MSMVTVRKHFEIPPRDFGPSLRRVAKHSRIKLSRRCARHEIEAGLEELEEEHEPDLAAQEAAAEYMEDLSYFEYLEERQAAARRYNGQLADAFVARLFANKPPRPQGRGPLYAHVDRVLVG